MTIYEVLIRGKIKTTSESTLDYPTMDLGKGGPVLLVTSSLIS